MSDLKSFDRVAGVYDETRGLPPDVGRAVGGGIARIAREAAPAPRLLEVGIGTGRIAVPLAAEGVRVAGIDISSKMLARLREKRGDIDVMLGEASRPPLRDASFDALLFVHILHLVPDPEGTLRATLPLLRPGGAVLFGGDDGQVGKRAEAEAIIRAAAAELAGVSLADWEGHARTAALVERVLGEECAGMRRVVLARWTRRGTGRHMIERLERQDYSSSWKIPRQALPAIIARVTPQLDALYGGLDREEAFERTFTLTVGRLRAR
ncbi:MAG: class I SAM-dependent methyltransferase [Chloroflexota bacterium]|nr:class I SAM-dependent methyltransferase [Chloroflexota bacterium]